jgi:hypothetical protein
VFLGVQILLCWHFYKVKKIADSGLMRRSIWPNVVLKTCNPAEEHQLLLTPRARRNSIPGEKGTKRFPFVGLVPA